MADQNMTIGLSANIDVSNVLSGVKQIQNALSGLKIDPKLTANLTKEFGNLQNYLRDYQKLLGKENMSKGDLKTLQKLEDSINSTFTKVIDLQNEISGKPILLKADSTQLDGLIQKTKEAKKALDDAFSKVNVGSSTGGITQIEGAIEKAVSRSKTLKQSFEDAFSDLGKGNLDQFSNKIDNIFQGLSGKVLKGKLIPTVDSLIDSFKKLGLVNVNINTDTAGEKLVALKSGIQALKDGIANGLNGEELKGLVSNLEAATKAEKEFEAEAAKRGQNSLNKQIGETELLAAATRDGAKAEREFQQATMSAVDQVKQLQQSTQYFFSLRNMINLLKRGVRQAFNTVKELDAAMTETAVVTKFDVSDMWEKLPEYTANANALGATVQDMYKSTTLYYQQGLDASQAMSIATETMKMARIGGLEAAEATDMMTAALRGFNMELNETSAQRINDVYSNLAAKTASNTEELGTAMQRTASIAASAGMSFEGTAAFLAQAIETTREPAENLGTAMKTIVARFQELKKNPLEMIEVDGEEVSYNKVDTALQSIGVSLKDTNGQFRDLDDVFLDISKRWDSLSQVQQRYIATTAAGSRQQSRFIAMMSNYERTTQLMDYANNSAGASNEQFGKTMESLEAKLNKLKNAYQQFTMGIANNVFIKGVVDGLTLIFNTTNKLINLFSGGNSIIKSFLSLFTAFTALKTGGRIINSLIGGLGGMVDPTSTFRAGFKSGAVGQNSAKAINQPIVAELRSIRQLIAQRVNDNNRRAVTGPYDQYDRFKSARDGFYNFRKNGGTVADVQKQFKGLNQANQNLLMRSFAGTMSATNRAILSGYQSHATKNNTIINAKDLLKGQRFLNNERQLARLSAEEYYKALQDPGALRDALKGAGISRNNATYKYLDSLNREIEKQLEENRNSTLTKLRNTQKYQDADEKQQKALEERVNENYKGDRQRRRATKQIMGEEANPNVTLKPWEKAVDSIGRVGSSLSQLGMGIQSFSSLLINSANPAISMFGSALSSVGGTISALGMTISGASSAFSAIAGKIGGPWTAAIGVALVAITALVAGIKAHNETIRKEAEKVSETYKENSQKNQSNINNLQQWKEELPRLALGVDANGLNINLDTGDYQRYLEIVDGIAEMNPAIIQGYNIQGHAIIDNNKALEETLALEQERGKEIFKNYTSTEAWTKLLEARNLESRSYAATGRELKPKNKMRTEASKIGKNLLEAEEAGLIDLTGLDIDLFGLAQGLPEQTEKFIQQYNTFKQRINHAIDEAGDEWSASSSKAIMKAFSSYDEASGELDELVNPIFQSMSVYASNSKAFQNLDEKVKPYYQQVLKSLAEDANIITKKDMQDAVDNTIEEIERIWPAFEEALEEIDEARLDFADSLNDTDYSNFIHRDGGPIEQLEELRKALEDTPNGDPLVQVIDNAMRRAEDRTIDGVQTISSALNTLSEELNIAESAQEEFEKRTEKDFSTAAEGMKAIFDKAMEKDDNGNYTHRGYKGDNTYWAAAQELLGDVSGKKKVDVDKMMDNLEPMLRDGPEGFANFALRVRESKDALKDLIDSGAIKWDNKDNFISKIDDSVDPEVWSKLAKTMGMSEQVLISLLNKGKQFADIDFSDNKAIRNAMANDEFTITGAKESEQTIYLMPAEELRNTLGDAEYAQNGEKKIAALAKENVYVIDEVAKFNEESAKTLAEKLGIVLGDNISLIDKLGQKYNKEDLQKIAEESQEALLGRELTDEEKQTFLEDFRESYKDWEQSQENELLAPVQSIESLVKQLAQTENKEKIESGLMTSDLLQSKGIDKAVYGKKDEIDSLAEFFKIGQDAQGEVLSETTFRQSRNELISLQNQLTDYREQLLTGLANAEEKHLDTSLYDQELKVVESALTDLATAIKEGTKNFEENANKPETEEGSGTSQQPGLGSGAQRADKREEDSRRWENNLPVWFVEAIKSDIGPRAEEASQSGHEKADEVNYQIAELLFKLDKTVFGGLADLFSSDNGQIGRERLISGGSSNETASNLGEIEANASEPLAVAGENLNTSATNLSTSAVDLTTVATKLDSAATTLSKAAVILSAGNASQNGNKGLNSQMAESSTAESSVSGLIVVDNSDALASLKEITTVANETKATIEEGATFKITVNDKGLEGAGDAAAQVVSAASNTQTISVGAGKVDLSSVDEAEKNIAGRKPQLNVDAKTKKATDAVDSWIGSIRRKTAYINVDVTTSGTHTLKFTVEKAAANGLNNHMVYPSLPSFGSAAKGSKYGTVGPNNKGGLTLTGEKGYEIAWIPSENRSMILGANGPQMVDLPSDAVVWTHDQSKQILKQKSIPAGSHATEGKADIGGISAFLATYQSNVGSVAASTIKKTGKKVQKEAENSAKLIGHVSVWWENIARQTEATQRRMDNSSKMFEKYIKELRSTLKKTGEALSTGGGGGDDYIKTVSKYIGYNESQLNKANKELTTLDKGTKAQQKAAKTKSKKDDKKANKAALNKGEASAIQVSYEVGKKKKKTKNEIINTSKYVVYDAENDTYLVNQKQLNKIKNKSKRKAVKEAVDKEINDRISKRNKAEDAIQKAKEALDKMGEELYNTFFKWKVELTEIWNITQQIEQTEARINRAKGYTELLDARLASGTVTDNNGFRQDYITSFSAEIQQLSKSIQLNMDSIDAQRDNLNRLMASEDEKTTLANVQQKLIDSIKASIELEKIQTNKDNRLISGLLEEARIRQLESSILNDTEKVGYEEYARQLERQINAQAKAWEFINATRYDDGTVDITFDTEKFEAEKLAGGFTEEFGKQIQDYAKEITESSKNLSEQIATAQSKTVEAYNTLKSLKDEWTGYANTLWDISETEQKKEVENAKKLSDSISKSLKDLLDEVKRKLDERRKQEDNAKTERDISQKQQRLAALRADTSGGHQVEIAQLEKEIAEAQQTYQRTLEDQMLDRLQQQADEASKQREQIISLQEAMIQATNNAALVNAWMNDPEKYQEEITAAFVAANKLDELPDALREAKLTELQTLLNGLITYKDREDETLKLIEQLETKQGTLDTLKGYIESIIRDGIQLNQATTGVPEGGTEDKVGAIAKYHDFLQDRGSNSSTDKYKGQIGKKGLEQQITRGAIGFDYTPMQVLQDLVDTDQLTWAKVLQAYVDLRGKEAAAEEVKAYFGDNPTDARKKGWKKVFGKDYPAYAYASGGLAKRTGPAWLDGTPSKPELVLNATDTKNFIALRDVLANVMKVASLNDTGGYSNATYEININVDHIANDYDVDKMAERVKKIIVKDSSYRNVTQVRKFR